MKRAFCFVCKCELKYFSCYVQEISVVLFIVIYTVITVL